MISLYIILIINTSLNYIDFSREKMDNEKKILILPFLLVVGRVMAPKDVHPLIPDAIEGMDLESGR